MVQGAFTMRSGWSEGSLSGDGNHCQRLQSSFSAEMGKALRPALTSSACRSDERAE
jgi:hypothetical protein